MLNLIPKNWLNVALPVVATLIMLWAGGCPPRTPSPINPTKKLTRAQLNAQFNNIIDRFDIAHLDLDDQERIRQIISKNVLNIATTGTFDPVGLLTGIAGAYGMATMTTRTVRTIKKRKPKQPA